MGENFVCFISSPTASNVAQHENNKKNQISEQAPAGMSVFFLCARTTRYRFPRPSNQRVFAPLMSIKVEG